MIFFQTSAYVPDVSVFKPKNGKDIKSLGKFVWNGYSFWNSLVFPKNFQKRFSVNSS